MSKYNTVHINAMDRDKARQVITMRNKIQRDTASHALARVGITWPVEEV
jgi:hypothetical protein